MRVRTYFTVALGLLPLLSGPAFADLAPRPGTADARIKTYTYHENDVYYLKGHYGYSMVIEFSPKERVESISMGDSEAWQVLPGNRKNLVYIKPLEQNAETNMTVLTSNRIYTFELNAEKATSPKSRDLTFRARFKYPDEEAVELANFSNQPAGKYDPLEGADISAWNFDYSYAGDRSLRPKRAFDDGTFTYFEFDKPGVTPAIFAVDRDGNESLVNFNTEGSYVIVNSLGQQFTLRDGDTSTCIFNDAYPKETGTQTSPAPVAELQEKEVSPEKEQLASSETDPPLPSELASADQKISAHNGNFDFFSLFHGRTDMTLND